MQMRLRLKIGIFMFIVLTAVSLLLSGIADSTLTVKPGQNIQSYINAAKPGQIIEVPNGTYHERVNVTKQLTLIGVGKPLVDAGGKGSAITISANGSTLIGFAATGSGKGAKDAGIRVLSRGNILKENIAIKNGNYGILLYHASNNTLIENAAVDNQNSGIMMVHSNNNQVFSNYASLNQDGILIQTSRGNTIKANNLTGNKFGINISNYNLSESITTKGKGVSIKYRSSNEVTSYNISNMSLGSSTGANLLYQNNLQNNGQNAFDDGFSQWDDGQAGNYYSSYDAREEGCKDRNRDGICDSGYSIPGGHNVDRLPKASLDAILQYRSKGLMGSELKMDQRTYQPGEDIKLKYVAPVNFSGWVGVMKPDLPRGSADQGNALSYQKLNSPSGIVFLKAPNDSGAYSLRMYNSTGAQEMVSLDLRVSIPIISVTPASVNACEMFTVSYSGAPGFESDWIAMYKSESADNSYITRQYLDGNENGTLTLEAPDPGRYNFRLFKNDSSTRLAVSSDVEAKSLAGIKVIATPSHVAPGGQVTVTYWGAPPEGTGVIGMYGMTRPDKFDLGKRPVGSKSCGHMTWQLPYDPGQYDFRLFHDDINRPILGQSNVVTVG
jgi:nitrous oxidase accessory protein